MSDSVEQVILDFIAEQGSAPLRERAKAIKPSAPQLTPVQTSKESAFWVELCVLLPVPPSNLEEACRVLEAAQCITYNTSPEGLPEAVRAELAWLRKAGKKYVDGTGA
jgi:hypothetical protein